MDQTSKRYTINYLPHLQKCTRTKKDIPNRSQWAPNFSTIKGTERILEKYKRNKRNKE